MTSRNIPTRIDATGGATDIVAVAAGAFHSVALKANGDYLTWGYNGTGQLGNAASRIGTARCGCPSSSQQSAASISTYAGVQ